MDKFVPKSLADFVPWETTDEFGYVWRKVQREHTLEIVGYDGDVEIGTAIILESDNSLEVLKRVEEISWVEDRVNIMYPDGMTMDRAMEVVRQQYDVYGCPKRDRRIDDNLQQ